MRQVKWIISTLLLSVIFTVVHQVKKELAQSTKSHTISSNLLPDG